LFQLLISQALNSSLLASPQARWTPLSFLPDIFTLLFFMINPLMISVSFSWVIINFIYFYAPTVTGMYPSNSFMDGSAIDSILPILRVFVTAFRTIVQRRSTDRWLLSKNSTTRLKDSKVGTGPVLLCRCSIPITDTKGLYLYPCPNTTPGRLRVQHSLPKLMFWH
jgi:hypothetical protein